MEGEDKENMADNSQSSQVSQEDVRAGYRSLIKDLVLAEDNILAAEAAAGEEGEGKITYDVYGGRLGVYPKSFSKLEYRDKGVDDCKNSKYVLADVLCECCARRRWGRHWP